MFLSLVDVRRHLRCAIILWLSYPRFHSLRSLHLGFAIAIVSGVRHNASELASALTCETIQRGPLLPKLTCDFSHLFLLNHIFIIKGLVLHNIFPEPCLFVLRDV
mgnify:CR=1 FL=1